MYGACRANEKGEGQDADGTGDNAVYKHKKYKYIRAYRDLGERTGIGQVDRGGWQIAVKASKRANANCQTIC